MFLLASMGITIAPGPDNLFVLAQGISQRRNFALAAAWGMVSGVTVHTTLAALGISALLLSSSWAFLSLKFAGAGYLFYLAILTYRSRNQAIEVDAVAVSVTGDGESAGSSGSNSQERKGASMGSMYRRGFLMNVLNPKVGIFFLAFLPQFVSPEAGNTALQMLLLGLIFMLQAFVIFSAIAWFSASIGSWLRRYASVNKALSVLTALIFAALGLKLILEKV